MAVLSSAEAYDKVVAYGRKKDNLPWDRLIILSIWSGIWVTLAGHAAMTIGGMFYSVNSPTATFVYGMIFPVAFIGVVLTNAELFTGNTMVMTIYAFDDMRNKARWIALVKNLSVSFVANSVAAVFGAFFITWTSGDFSHVDSKRSFLTAICEKKLNYSFYVAFVKAIGCNIFVCAGTWSLVVVTDTVGRFIAIWFYVAGFCYAGFEHIIANMYTLSCCTFEGLATSPLEVIYKNLIPVFLGNVVAGTLVTGVCWWHVFKPLVSDAYHIKDKSNDLNRCVLEMTQSDLKNDIRMTHSTLPSDKDVKSDTGLKSV